MASSSITFRRRNVTFTNRPPQVVRYSYHGGADASTSLSSTISKYPPILPHSNEPTYQNMNNNNNNDTSSSISSSPPIYDNVPSAAMISVNTCNSPINNNDNGPKPFAPIPPRKPAYLEGRRISTGHRWANNDGIEKIDVIQKATGVTHVNIGDKSYYNNVNNVVDDDEDEEMAMHLYECIEQFNTACDKILGARQLIDTDTSLTQSDREKLLRLVNKSITQGRGRLENFEQQVTPSAPSSNRTTTLSGGTGSNASMGGPSHLASPSPTPSEPRINIDASFINRYGPQIMHLLQENMSKQN
jgi:hypothetical protein